MRFIRRVLVLAGLAILVRIAVVDASVALAQPQLQPGNAVQAVPNSAATATGGYVTPPPPFAPDYCAPPATLSKGHGHPASCRQPPPCPSGTVALAVDPFWRDHAVALCCPQGWGLVVGGGCCPTSSSGLSNGYLVGVSANSAGVCTGSNYASAGTQKVVAVSAPCPNRGDVNPVPDSAGGSVVCETPPACPPGYDEVSAQCVATSTPATPVVVNPNQPQMPHLPNCAAGQVWTSVGGCCVPAQATWKGLCCPAGQVPKNDGSCGFPPAAQNANQIPPPIEQYKIPPQGSVATPVTVPNVTSVQAYPPGPICAPPATLIQVRATLFAPAQTTAPPIDACAAPAQNCPAGTYADGVTTPPNGNFYCCPNGTSIGLLDDHTCCPQGAFRKHGSTCSNGSQAIPATPVQCPNGGIAIAHGSALHFVCVTPAACTAGFTLTGTSCCPNDMVSSLGFCCPPGQPPHAGGGCTLNPPQQNVNVPSAPVVNLVACPNDLVRRDAFAGDAVCVTRATRAQIIVDNTAAPSRTRPNGNCRPGFVWREAGPRDHACVPPASRTQVSVDNRQRCGGDLHCLNGVVSRPTSTKTVVEKPSRPRRGPPPRTHIDKPRTTSGHPTSFRSTTRRNDRHR